MVINMINKIDHEALAELTQSAMPINDDDYGSSRQVDAEIKLADYIISILGDDFFFECIEKIECFKLSIDESIQYLQHATLQRAKEVQS